MSSPPMVPLIPPTVVRSLDDAIKVNLQGLRAVYFAGLLLCTAIVAIGVLIEEVEYFATWPSVLKRVPLRLLLPRYKFAAFVRRVSKVGWLMIILGVAGEGVYEGLVSYSDRQLQTLNDLISAAQDAAVKDLGRISARARDDAEIATKASGEARMAAGNATSLARAARQETDSFEKRIASANKTALTAESHLTEALRLNLALQSDVAKLQAAALWRSFPESQRDKLISLAKQSLRKTPTFTVTFDSIVGNPEAKRFGDKISSALAVALGIPIDKPPGLSNCLECTGISICVNESAAPETLTDAIFLRGLLDLSGIKPLPRLCKDPKNGLATPTSIKIIVGPKE
jgi:hypothetical protein